MTHTEYFPFCSRSLVNRSKHNFPSVCGPNPFFFVFRNYKHLVGFTILSLIQNRWGHTSMELFFPQVPLSMQLERANYTQRNLIKSTRNQIVFTIFPLIWNQTNVRFVPYQSENGKYNMISSWFNKISKIFLCVMKKRLKITKLLRCQKAHSFQTIKDIDPKFY